MYNNLISRLWITGWFLAISCTWMNPQQTFGNEAKRIQVGLSKKKRRKIEQWWHSELLNVVLQCVACQQPAANSHHQAPILWASHVVYIWCCNNSSLSSKSMCKFWQLNAWMYYGGIQVYIKLNIIMKIYKSFLHDSWYTLIAPVFTTQLFSTSMNHGTFVISGDGA